jgi:glycosyltransferase involved in cell wall biosynthesis
MIVINARFLTQQVSGVQRFAEQLCLELANLRDDLLFVAPHGIRRSESAERLQVRCIGRHRGHLWEQLDLPLWLARHGHPPLLSLCNTAPLACRNQIAAHHDITYVRHPESYSRRFRSVYRCLTPLLLRRARALLTVSEFSRSEICSHYRYPAERVHVVANAVDARFQPPAGNVPSSAATRYLLAVASPAAHKNITRLVQAFLRLKVCADTELRIIGGLHPAFAAAPDIQGSPRIRMLGRLDDAELVRQYQGATAFVFPSLYEGFGIPPLEAQACGCPVIAARAASIPEVLGESALYFDPHDVEDMAFCMTRVLLDERLRDDLRRRGQANVARYSWQRSARQVSQLIDSVLAERSASRAIPEHQPLDPPQRQPDQSHR